jgi:hypothetical protein
MSDKNKSGFKLTNPKLRRNLAAVSQEEYLIKFFNQFTLNSFFYVVYKKTHNGFWNAE